MRYVILRWKDYEDKDKYDLDDSGYSGEKKSVRKKKKKRERNQVKRQCWSLIKEESQSLAVEGKSRTSRNLSTDGA